MAVDLDAIAKQKLDGILLKREQKENVDPLLRGKDVFAVLPTGFGKSHLSTFYCGQGKIDNSQRTSPTNSCHLTTEKHYYDQIKSASFTSKRWSLILKGQRWNRLQAAATTLSTHQPSMCFMTSSSRF